jgi:AraC-like DNA-binding protein
VLSLADKDDIVLLQNEISSVEYIIDRSYEMGLRVVFNPSPIKENVTRIDLNMLSHIIINTVEAKMITGAEGESALNILKDKYPNLAVILTLGIMGSIYQDKNERIYTPSFEVNAVDTTAAGDTFTGYFVAGLVAGRKTQDSLKTASLASAIAVSREGAAPSIPTQEEVEAGLLTMKQRKENARDTSLSQKIEKYIKDNIKDLTLSSLAGHLGYSPVYTGALVKRLFGMSFTDLVVDRRLSVAKELLKYSEMSIEEVIRSVGYENESHFRRKFREKFNTSPLKYRKSHK